MEIEIPRELADAQGVPEDLDANIVGPYRFPSPVRRRAAGWVYVGAASIAVVGAVTVLPVPMLWVGAAFIALAGYHFLASHGTRLNEDQALAAAGRQVPFPIGHASAALRFEGARSYPVWNVLVYDAEDPPTQRALVFVDAVTGADRRPAYIDSLGGSGVSDSVN